MRQMVQLQMGSSVVCLGVVPSNTARFNDTLLFVTVLGPSSLQGVEGSILPLHGRRDITVKWNLDQDGRSPCWAISYYSSLCRREVVGVRPGDMGLRRTTGGSLGFPNPKSSNNEMKKVTVTIPTLTQACRGVKTHRGGSWQCYRWRGGSVQLCLPLRQMGSTKRTQQYQANALCLVPNNRRETSQKRVTAQH